MPVFNILNDFVQLKSSVKLWSGLLITVYQLPNQEDSLMQDGFTKHAPPPFFFLRIQNDIHLIGQKQAGEIRGGQTGLNINCKPT